MKKFKKKFKKATTKIMKFTKGNEITLALSLCFITMSVITLTVF